MFGLVMAAVSVFVLLKVLRRVGYLRRFGAGGYAGYGCHGGMRRSRGARSWLRSVFERMGTTPSQERVIMHALDELRSNRSALVEEATTTRSDLGSAISSGLVDDTTLEETFARHDRLLARLRVSFVEALKQINEVLDDGQRKQLADALRNRGSGWFGGGSPWSDRHQDVWA